MSQTKYQVTIHFPEEDESLEDVFDSESEAREAALDYISAWNYGCETLNLSNPGDYPYDEDAWREVDYDIYEVDG